MKINHNPVGVPNRRGFILALAICALGVLWGSSSIAQAQTADPSRWNKDMAAFAAADQEHPASPGGVLFVGSSSIRLWTTLAEDFPGVPVLNRGFGGSWISDSVAHFDRLVIPSKPRLIVFYAGNNDIAGGKSAEDVAADFRTFCLKVHTELPQTRIVFIAITLNPARWAKRAEMALANTYIAAFCAADQRRTFLDVNSEMLAFDGQPQLEYFIGDRLHMTPAGYAVWARMLRPLVIENVCPGALMMPSATKSPGSP